MSIHKSGTNEQSSRDEARFNVRLPKDLHNHLVRRAAANGRSMNAEIITILASNLDLPDETLIRQLHEKRRALMFKLHDLKTDLASVAQQHEAVVTELRALEERHNIDPAPDPE